MNLVQWPGPRSAPLLANALNQFEACYDIGVPQNPGILLAYYLSYCKAKDVVYDDMVVSWHTDQNLALGPQPRGPSSAATFPVVRVPEKRAMRPMGLNTSAFTLRDLEPQ